MSDNFVNQVTLECFMNKDQYHRHVAQKVAKQTNKKDVKFYRKRIVSLTRDLLYGTGTESEDQETQILSPDINYSFQEYIKTCIHHFKSLDRCDIIQEDYAGIVESVRELTADEIVTQEEADKLLMRSILLKEAPTLDKFIKRTTTAPEVAPILPKQKDINLRDPILKNKGVGKKKNIHNKYEDKETKITP